MANEERNNNIPNVTEQVERRSNNGPRTGIAGLVLVTIPTLFCGWVFAGSKKPYESVSLSDVISRNQGIVEYYNEQNPEGFTKIIALDNYAEMCIIAKRIEKLDLSQYTNGCKPIEVDYSLDLKEIRKDLDRFNELLAKGETGEYLSSTSEEFLELAISLTETQNYICKAIQYEGFEFLSQVGTEVLGAQVANGAKVGTSYIPNMSIVDDKDGNYIKATGLAKDYNIEIPIGYDGIGIGGNIFSECSDMIANSIEQSNKECFGYDHDIIERFEAGMLTVKDAASATPKVEENHLTRVDWRVSTNAQALCKRLTFTTKIPKIQIGPRK